MMDASTIATFVKTHLNIPRIGMLINSIDGDLDESQYRFLKGRIIEMSLQEYSKGKIQYIGQCGVDCIIPELDDVGIEVKFIKDKIYTKHGSLYPTTTIKLYNTNGGSGTPILPPDYANFLLCLSNRGIILVTKDVFNNESNISILPDGISTTFPTHQSIILAGICDIDIPYTPIITIKQLLESVFIDYINSIPTTPPNPLENFFKR